MGKETKTPTPIVKIGEVIRDIRHDVREGKMPKMVFKRKRQINANNVRITVV